MQCRCQFVASGSHKIAIKSILLFRDFVFNFLTCASVYVLKALLDMWLMPPPFNIATPNLLVFCVSSDLHKYYIKIEFSDLLNKWLQVKVAAETNSPSRFFASTILVTLVLISPIVLWSLQTNDLVILKSSAGVL